MEPTTHSSLIIEVTDATFAAEVEGAQGFVLADMWADWCTPCHMLAEHLDRMAVKLAGNIKFVKLDVDNNIQTGQKYNVMSLPTLLLFKDGQLIGQSIGFRPEPALMEWLKEKGVNTTPTTVPVAEELAVPMPAEQTTTTTTEVTTAPIAPEVTAQPEQVVTETTTITETATPNMSEISAPMPVTDSLTTTTTTETGTMPPMPTEAETILPPLPSETTV